MPSVLSSLLGDDVRKQWLCARVLSMRFHRASANAIRDQIRQWDDGDWSVTFGIVEEGSPQLTLCEKPGYILIAIGGVPSIGVARRFVQGYANIGQFAGGPTLNSEALRLGDPVVEVTQTMLARNPSHGTICGYSMGGVMAAYVAAFLQNNGFIHQFECITFGSPRYGKASFSDTCPGGMYRIFNRDDPLPFLPVWSTEEAGTYWTWRALFNSSDPNVVVHNGYSWKLAENGRTEATVPNFPADGIGTSMLGWAIGVMSDPVIEHAIATYETRLYNLALPRLELLLPIVQPEPILELRVPPATPVVQPPVQAMIQRIPIPERVIPPAPPIPAGVRSSRPFYAARLNARGRHNPEWWVWHWDQPLFRTKDRSKAKKAASRLNSLALAWSQSTAGEQFDLIDAIQIEFPPE